MLVASLLSLTLALSSEKTSESLFESLTVGRPHAAIQLGDVPNTAYTPAQGTWLLRPWFVASYAVSERLELKTSLARALSGVNLGAKYVLVRSSTHALALESQGERTYSGSTLGSLLVRSSFQWGPGFFNASVGASLAHTPAFRIGATQLPEQFAWAVPFAVTYQWLLDAQTQLGFGWEGQGAVFGPALQQHTLRANWQKGLGRHVQLNLGLGVFFGQPDRTTSTLLQTFNLPGSGWLLLPFPDLSFTLKL